jgi:hypothetical protein
MIARVTAHGLRAAVANKRLLVTLWLFNLALALAAGIPGWRALADALGPLPAADSLAEAFSFGVLGDLTELRPGLVTGLGNAALAVFGLGLLVGLVATGGSLEVLLSRDDRPFAHRFGRGAFRFFGRFLRLGAITSVVAVLLVALVAGPLFALGRFLRRESGSEWLALAVSLAAPVAAGLLVLLALLVQDAARVRIVREDPRRVLPVLRGAFPLVLRHPAKWLGAWAWNAALLLAVFAAYLALAGAFPAGPALVALIVLQQVFVLVRCGLRVALLGAEIELVSALRPLRPPSPQPELELPAAPASGPPPEPA